MAGNIRADGGYGLTGVEPEAEGREDKAAQKEQGAAVTEDNAWERTAI